MRHNILLAALFAVLVPASLTAQKYDFKDKIRLKTTGVEDQNVSGTCWCFSFTSFIETEMIRKGLSPINLSEMYIVRNCYVEKADRYVRDEGKSYFTDGGLFHDVAWAASEFGLMPQNDYKGIEYAANGHDHTELQSVLSDFLKSICKQKTVSSVWRNAYAGILDAYLGKVPEKFMCNGKTYTPKSFMSQVVQFEPSDYVSITSFTHHPFYSQFILEVPDNWMHGAYYNVPVDELESIVDNALTKGYSVIWGADVSEPGFSLSGGVMVVPETDLGKVTAEEAAALSYVDTDDEDEMNVYVATKPVTEKSITQQMRQAAFDSHETTDDHSMLIVGTATDSKGGDYYLVKNSWGEIGPYKGYQYASKNYFRYKTLDIMVHKDAIPQAIRQKLKL
ncbi:MAG: aminopeptidase [Bacteroidales bacterium]|nr:aminopeptidase [Bacteroidales bacterium]